MRSQVWSNVQDLPWVTSASHRSSADRLAQRFTAEQPLTLQQHEILARLGAQERRMQAAVRVRQIPQNMTEDHTRILRMLCMYCMQH